MKVTFLGTGGAFTDFRVNYHNNLLVETAVGPVLIDCGGTAPQSLRELGIKPWDVHSVLVTHLHGDHVGGIEQLVWERYYLGQNGPGFLEMPLIATSEVFDDVRGTLEPCLREHTSRDGRLSNEGFAQIIRHIEAFPGGGCEGTSRAVEVGGVRFSLHRTPHVSDGHGEIDKPCYGVLLESGSECAYFTSDTTFRADIGERFPTAEVLFHDCTFSPRFDGTVHTHYDELLSLPAEVRRRVVLMHYTSIPDGIDVLADGFRGAAARHESFTFPLQAR